MSDMKISGGGLGGLGDTRRQPGQNARRLPEKPTPQTQKAWDEAIARREQEADQGNGKAAPKTEPIITAAEFLKSRGVDLHQN